jgi:hypothetical protein
MTVDSSLYFNLALSSINLRHAEWYFYPDAPVSGIAGYNYTIEFVPCIITHKTKIQRKSGAGCKVERMEIPSLSRYRFVSMRRSYLFLLLVFFNIAKAQSQMLTFADSLFHSDTFSIEYNSGGCFPEQGKLIFYREGPQWIAVNKDHWHRYGKHTDTSWTTALSDVKIAFLKEVIDTAGTHGLYGFENVDEGTACYYLIQHDSFLKILDCNPYISKLYSFDGIEAVLFREKFADLESQRTRIKDSVKNIITGAWIVQIPKNSSIHYRDTLRLSRLQPNGQTDSITWTFGPDGSFRSTGLKHSHLLYSRAYEIDAESEEKIVIANGYKTAEGKGKDFVHLGASLRLISATEDQIILLIDL